MPGRTQQPWDCKYCGKTVKQKYGHVRTHHPEMIDDYLGPCDGCRLVPKKYGSSYCSRQCGYRACGQAMIEAMTDPERRTRFQQAIREGITKRGPRSRQPLSEATKKKISDANVRTRASRSARVSAVLRSMGERHPSKREDVKTRAAETRARTWAQMDPAIRAKKRARIVAAMQAANPSGSSHSSKRPEVRAKISRSRGKYTGPSSTESKLWSRLDQSRFKLTACDYKRTFNQPISADIIEPMLRIIVQVDGCYWHECPQHGKGHQKDQPIRDARLTSYAKAEGWTVLRFWEHDILHNIETVLTTIADTVDSCAGAL